MKILFINACVRKDSRTLRLCHHYLNLIKQTDPLKNCVIQTVNLQEKELRPLNEESLKLREEDINRQAFADSRYDCAKDFAAADLILIGAPYWDFSFPATLKIYFENICINRLTFYYDEQGIPNSLCMEQQARSGQPISLMELAAATHREEREKKKSVMEQLKSQPKAEHKKTAPKKSAEREI